MAMNFPDSPTTGQTFSVSGGPTYSYDGAKWRVLTPGNSFARTAITATAGQTSFSVVYTVGAIDVFQNGVKLVSGSDFTATTGTTIVLTNGANAGDTIEVVSYSQITYTAVSLTSNVTGTLPVANGGTGLTSLTAGYIPFGGSTTYGSDSNLFWDDTNKHLGVGTTSPQFKFDITGDIHIGSSTQGALRFGAIGNYTYAKVEYDDTNGNFNINNPRAYPIRFLTNNTEAMRITSAGDVGIGTSSPSSRLHISGSSNTAPSLIVAGLNAANGIMQFGSTNSNYQIFGGAYQGQMVYATDTGTPHLWWVGGGEKMRLDASGNLGLGVTPSAWGTYKSIQIGGEGAGFYGRITGGTLAGFISNGYWNGTKWVANNTGTSGRYEIDGNAHKWYYAASTSYDDDLAFTPAMTLDASGRLYVGSSNSTARLNITNGIAGSPGQSNQIVLYDGTPGNPSAIFGFGISAAQLTYNSGGGAHVFYTGGNASPSPKMTLDASGNLGIGTSSPNGRVHGRQDSAGGTTYTLIADNGAGGAGTNLAAVGFQNGGAQKASIRAAVYGNGYMAFHTDNDTEKMRIDSSGNLLVGTTSSDAKFVTTTTGNVWAGRFLNSSAGGTPNGLQVVVGQDGTNVIFQVAQGTSFTTPTNLFRVQGNGLITTLPSSSGPYNYSVGATNVAMYVDNSGNIGKAPSIRAAKMNINPLADVGWVYDLEPVTFNFRKRDESNNYTSDVDGGPQFGMIADDVEKICDMLCHYNSDGTLSGIAYEKLTVPLLKAVQLLAAKVSALEAKQ